MNRTDKSIVVDVATKELINNTLKYAKASQIVIEIKLFSDKLEYFYKDNGIGFKQSEIKEGHGMNNIRSRAAALDGKIEINGNPGTGMTAKIKIEL